MHEYILCTMKLSNGKVYHTTNRERRDTVKYPNIS